MRLYDTITQSELNNVIDLLLYNYHREISLDIDEPSNDYCGLSFDLSDGVDTDNEVIFNNGDELRINVSDKRLALMGYTLRLFYYQLDKGDYSQSKSYGELQSLEVKLDNDTVSVPFSSNQVYLQKTFDLILIKEKGYHLQLSSDKTVVMSDESLVLTADYTYGTLPVEDATVSFYDGETLIGTGVTNSNGIAKLTLSDLSIGSHNFNAVVNSDYSNIISVDVISNNVMTLNVTGSSFSTSSYASTPFIYNGKLFVDWGDDTGLLEYNGGKLSHTFSDGLNSHAVKIYGGITSLGEYCFYECTGLTSIEIPSSITSLGDLCFTFCFGLTSIEIPSSITSLGEYCFYECTGLTSILLNWDTSNKILTYNSEWITGTSSSLKFSIPNGTTSLYTAKNYPSNKLEERQ